MRNGSDWPRHSLDRLHGRARKFCVASCDTLTLLDPVEEPFDQVTKAIKLRAEADRLLAIAVRRDICKRALLPHKRPIQSASYPRSASNIVRCSGTREPISEFTWGCSDRGQPEAAARMRSS